MKQPKKNVKPPPLVTQAELQELLKLDEPYHRYSSLRASVINRLDLGAEIEPGQLTAGLDVQSRRMPSWAALEAFFRTELLDVLRDLIPATPVRHLKLFDKGKLVGRGEATQKNRRGHRQRRRSGSSNYYKSSKWKGPR